ncbi:MAG: MFS transporter [Brevundimonas sp.]|uniref:MFS transporter n=1 Tax=Brevundimonas sp. TaxID=1871086 RepID=UPI002736D9BE|nr:MFS transporter [Brevundimonas sp.]MDP3379438.1 MFS transporter [Brevundimonas sp.]
MFAANGLTMGAWAPQIPPLIPRHQIGEATLGLVILALGLGAVMAMLFTGRLIARFGGRPVLTGFALALAPTLPLIVLAPSVPALFAAAALFGAVAGSMDVAMNAAAVKVERSLGRAIMSASHGFWSLGGFVGAALGAWVLAHWGSMTQALVTAGAVLGLVALALPHLLPDPPAPVTAGHGAGVLLPRDPALWLLGLLALLCMVPEGAVMDWAALYLGQELGADALRSGLGFAFFAATMAVMRFSGDALRNRFGAVRTLRVSALIGAAGLMLAAVAPADWLAMAGFAFAGLGVANLVPVMFSAAGNHPGLPPGQAIATVTMVGYAGILIAPASIGYIAEQVGFRATYGGLALLLVLVAGLAARARSADGIR